MRPSPIGVKLLIGDTVSLDYPYFLVTIISFSSLELLLYFCTIFVWSLKSPV